MKAAVYEAPGRVVVRDVPKPVIAEDEILIQLVAASICGTDLRISRYGHFKLPSGQERVLGHEIVGIVAEVGTEVSGFAVGERVTATPNIGCGRCEFCRQGLNNMCPDYEAFGVTIDGGFEEFLRVPGFALQRGNIFKVPDSVSDRSAALVEPLSCCLRGQRALGVGYSDTVVIVGAGPIGIFHTMLARLAGARKVIVSNFGASRLVMAEQVGAHVVVNVEEESLAEAVRRETGGRGADVVITCVSNPSVQTEAVELLANHGRVNFFAGLGTGGEVPINTNLLHYKGLVLTGTTGSSNYDYDRALSLVADGRVDLAQLISRTFRIDDINEAMEHAASGSGMKAMVLFGNDAERQ
jgi:threonine dehydrogenase-like Zn-dependent dehydrogenase